MLFHLTPKSSNAKTGPIPVSTSSAETCPSACPMKGNGCYASAGGPLALHWRAVTEERRGVDFAAFVAAIAALPAGTLWRHNQAGDLPGTDNRVDRAALLRLAKANAGKRGFTYTHKPLNKRNLDAIKQAVALGFTVNASADTLSEADACAATGLPTVVVLPADAPRGIKTPEGRTVAICPAQLSDKVTCSTCGLCQRADRGVVIGFRAHGSQAKKAAALSAEDIARRAMVRAAIASAKAGV